MKNYTRIIAVGALSLMLAFTLGVSRASAQTAAQSTAEQIAALLERIADLREQLAALEGRQGDLRSDIRETAKLARDLARGMTGEDVSELQKLLASDPEIYPEGIVSGFFGPLTERALAKWQAKFGLGDENGRLGPKTRLALNVFWRHGGWKRFLEDDTATSTGSTTPGVRGQKAVVCHKPEGEDAQTLRIAPPALHAHLAHGDDMGACPASDDDDDDDDGDDEDDEDDDEDDEDEEEVRATLDEGESDEYELLGDEYGLELLSVTDEDDLDGDEEPVAVFEHDGEESDELEEGDEFEFDDGLEIEVEEIDADDEDGEATFVLSVEADDEDDDDSDEENAQDAIDDAEDAIEEAEDAVEEAEDDDDDTAEAEELLDDAKDKLEEAQDAFDDEDFDDAEDLADEAEDLAEQAIDAL